MRVFYLRITFHILIDLTQQMPLAPLNIINWFFFKMDTEMCSVYSRN